ncbi:MAG: phosphodiester glycosidase family protein [Myxococcales bacterium]|nr:phosphodiester glycosidase family protein [Myxococcales bacterium]
MRRCSVALLVLLVPASTLAAPATGELDDPIALPENPFRIAGSTAGRASVIDAYACDPTLDESGGELFYRVEVPARGKLTAWLEGDGGGVDVDVHVLSSLEIEGGVALDCVARANQIVEPVLDAGTYYVVVDTFEGDAQSGEFILHATFIGDAWVEHEPYEGVVWRARRFEDVGGGPQIVHELRLDPTVTQLVALPSNGCETVATIGAAAGAAVGINGGYFNVSTCDPVSLLIHEGELLGTHGSSRSAFGIDAAGAAHIQIVGAGEDWPDVEEAHGGAPRLVTAGVAHTTEAEYAEESVGGAGFIGPNPRTGAGIFADGSVSLFTIDGRGANQAGMSLPAMADFAKDELGLADAMNLDGGGSTTMWIAGMTPNGVMNYPSDSSVDEPTGHTGSRAVSGGFFIFAEPKRFAPVITTSPPAVADLQAPSLYDADAYDANPLDAITFSLSGAPEGMLIDPDEGVITWQPVSPYPTHVELTLVASDGKLETTQAISLDVPGGVEATTSVGAGAGGAAVGLGGGGGGESADEAGGCSCEVASGRDRGAWSIAALAATLLSRVRRRARLIAGSERQARYG